MALKKKLITEIDRSVLTELINEVTDTVSGKISSTVYKTNPRNVVISGGRVYKLITTKNAWERNSASVVGSIEALPFNITIGIIVKSTKDDYTLKILSYGLFKPDFYVKNGAIYFHIDSVGGQMINTANYALMQSSTGVEYVGVGSSILDDTFVKVDY